VVKRGKRGDRRRIQEEGRKSKKVIHKPVTKQACGEAKQEEAVCFSRKGVNIDARSTGEITTRRRKRKKKKTQGTNGKEKDAYRLQASDQGCEIKYQGSSKPDCSPSFESGKEKKRS